ncbi:MAG: acetolactate synthase small subunit [Gemmatimonadaceae bacterium]
MSHTIVALMQDRPGVLNRAVSLMRRHGCNIGSLTVGRSETPGVSTMIAVVDAEEVTQVVRHLSRLVEVLAAREVSDVQVMEREARDALSQADGIA